MNFTEKQKKCCRKLLNQLDYEVILSLSNTVSGKSVSVYGREEAIEAILAFSASASELLSRQKITRDYLKQYLFSQHVSVPGNSLKPELISRILEHWSEERISHTIVQPPTKEQTHLASPEAQPIPTGDLTQFGQTFASWFYKMLNSRTESTLSADHFWPQCALHLLFVSEAKNEERTEGADLVACRLKRLVCEENLYFNANITGGGVMSEAESVGIVCVMVHGTVHKGDQCLGVFEQKFALLRDPSSENNWKITRVSLKVYANAYVKNSTRQPIS